MCIHGRLALTETYTVKHKTDWLIFKTAQQHDTPLYQWLWPDHWTTACTIILRHAPLFYGMHHCTTACTIVLRVHYCSLVYTIVNPTSVFSNRPHCTVLSYVIVSFSFSTGHHPWISHELELLLHLPVIIPNIQRVWVHVYNT